MFDRFQFVPPSDCPFPPSVPSARKDPRFGVPFGEKTPTSPIRRTTAPNGRATGRIETQIFGIGKGQIGGGKKAEDVQRKDE